MEYLTIEECEDGQLYRGVGRNFNVARFNGKWFIGVRHKFGFKPLDKELYYDLSLYGIGGTFKPIEKVK